MIGNVVLVLGQSNAMNFGTSGLPFPGGWTSDAGIQIWNGFKTTPGFEAYNPGINSNGDTSDATWGPEAEYCRQRRLARPNETIYIVKHAIGGCGLAQKSNGTPDYSPYSGATKEWEKMLASVIAACNYCNGAGYRVIIDTALICNGETDTLLQADANAFQYNLQMFLTSIRGRLQTPNMRAVMMRPFPNSTQGGWLSTVRTAIQTVGGYYRNAWINTDDLTPTVTPNDGHLVPTSVVTLGARMFAADQAILP